MIYSKFSLIFPSIICRAMHNFWINTYLFMKKTQMLIFRNTTHVKMNNSSCNSKAIHSKIKSSRLLNQAQNLDLFCLTTRNSRTKSRIAQQYAFTTCISWFPSCWRSDQKNFMIVWAKLILRSHTYLQRLNLL